MREAVKRAIFIIGGTGYIGGSILHLLLERGYLATFTISVLVRNAGDTAQLAALGIRPVPGTIDDLALLASEAAQADLVISNANCDHDASVAALLAGLSKRADQTGERPVFIHTSGAGVLSANSRGLGLNLEEDSQASIWDDADVEAHLRIPASAPHRHVDLHVLAAARAGKVKTYLVVPPTVFGKGLGPFAEKRMSIQIPRLVYYSLQKRRVMTVGQGENQWTAVHVADLADLYLRILEGALRNTAPEGLAGIYYPATEFFTWSAVSHRIAQLLTEQGLLASAAVTAGLPTGWFWGSNVRMRSTNGTLLGWLPTHGGTQQMLHDVAWDVQLMREMLSQAG